MPRARNQVEKLGCRIYEVENLRDEQQEQCLAEVAEDADDGEDHAGKVAVCIADEDTGWVAVVGEQGEGDAEKGKEEV